MSPMCLRITIETIGIKNFILKNVSETMTATTARTVRTTTTLEVYPTLKVGVGHSIGQHGELFQGQIEDKQYRQSRCLISLPCGSLISKATFRPDFSGKVSVTPPYKDKVKQVVEVIGKSLNVPSVGGQISVESNIPEGKGYGSSTADCIAAAIAVGDAIGHRIRKEELARMVVEAEIASDSFMFKQAVLFAHREGRVLEDYGKMLPMFEVLGFDTDLHGIVDTLDYPPAIYSQNQIQTFQMLAGALRYAIRQGDIRLLAKIAMVCADVNQHFLPKNMFKEIRAAVLSAGALGIAVAHSGTVVAILLDPKDPSLQKKVDTIIAELMALGIQDVMRFHT
jgi:uncharacterized protein involved in propanediol utilization